VRSEELKRREGINLEIEETTVTRIGAFERILKEDILLRSLKDNRKRFEIEFKLRGLEFKYHNRRIPKLMGLVIFFPRDFFWMLCRALHIPSYWRCERLGIEGRMTADEFYSLMARRLVAGAERKG